MRADIDASVYIAEVNAMLETIMLIFEIHEGKYFIRDGKCRHDTLRPRLYIILAQAAYAPLPYSIERAFNYLACRRATRERERQKLGDNDDMHSSLRRAKRGHFMMCR